MEKSEYFVPHIFVTKNCSPKSNFNYQPADTMHKIYEFFKNKGMRVFYAYDFENDNYIPFEEMSPKPDIVYYCHPWYIYKTQGPVMASKYALTYYSSYSVPSSMGYQEYYLRFHQYIGTQYVINDLVKNHYSKNMANKGANLKTAGHPILDYFYLNRERKYENKNSIIYAPHFSINDNSLLKWGTFLTFGEYILDFAKKHPEYNWIFKPHPCLKSFIKNQNIWDDEKINKYWQEWKNIGTVYESGDYLDMFMESKMMITDCGSFKTEYFMTQKPQIYLKSPNGYAFNESVNRINETSYKAETIEDLEEIFNQVLIKGDDYKCAKRASLYKELGYENLYTAKNILNDMLQTVGKNAKI